MSDLKNFIMIQKETNPVFLIMFLGLIILSGWVVPKSLFMSFFVVIFAFVMLFIGNYDAIRRIKNEK